MGQLDKKWLEYMYEEEAKKKSQTVEDPYDPQSTAGEKSLKQKIDEAISNLSSSNITSRGDIINPEEWLSDYYKFIPTTVEGIAEYNHFLQLLRNIQAQQQASYDEWYNSPLQQSVRDKSAGLNPDILGLSGSSTSSPDVGSGTPTQGLPTSDELAIHQEQLRLQKFSNLISAVGSIANLSSVFGQLSQLPLQKQILKGQIDAQNIANLSQFEQLVSNEVSSRLSDSVAGSLVNGGLDIASWFADDKNFEGIFEAYSPSDTPVYRQSFANVRKRMQSSLGKAYEQGKITAENQGSFAALAADPTYSGDVLVQLAQLRPYMIARRELELAKNEYETALNKWNTKYREALDLRSAIDVANAQNDYNAEYYSNMDGEKQAIFDTYIKKANSIAAQMQSKIDSNMMAIYDQNSNNYKGIAAAYLYSGGVSRSWYEYLLGSELMYDFKGEVRDNSHTFVNPLNPSDVGVPGTNPPPMTGASSSPASIRQFLPPFSIGF